MSGVYQFRFIFAISKMSQARADIFSILQSENTVELPHIKPMELSRRMEPFDDADWIFELKHDGFRGVAYIADGQCKLVSRKNYSYKSFTLLRTAIAKELRVEDAILDGEIVCLDAQGRSVFKELLYRRSNPFFYAFDLLWLNGRDLRQLPLLERKRMLRRLIRGKHSRLIYAHHVKSRGCELFQLICEQNLEGIVAKRKDGFYSSSAKWIKIKNPNYTQAEGRHELFESLRSARSPLFKPSDLRSAT
jgi:bifunctional non-homologous end joining protein LigD